MPFKATNARFNHAGAAFGRPFAAKPAAEARQVVSCITPVRGYIASMAETPRGFLQAGERALRLSERRPAVRGGETFAVQGRQRARLIHGPPGRLGGLSCGCDRETLYQTNDDC